MSQCTDVDAALKRLEDKINAQNREIARFKQLQQQCCANKGGSNSNNNSLEARVRALEKDQAALKTGMLETLANFADIENTNREFTLAFQGMHTTIFPLIDLVLSLFETIGG